MYVHNRVYVTTTVIHSIIITIITITIIIIKVWRELCGIKVNKTRNTHS
jgi:hypothetical protein